MSFRHTVIRIVRIQCIVTACGLFAQSAQSQTPISPPAGKPLPAPTPIPPTTAPEKKLKLGECLAIAEANHPSIKMAEASLSQTMKGSASLQKVPPRLGSLVRPDLPIRIQQSCRGIDAAVANCTLVRQLVVNDVCRMYYTYIYAKQQEGVVNEIAAQLNTYKELVEEYLKRPINPDDKLKINKTTLDLIVIALNTANSRLIEAQYGKLRALAALKQAMGIDPTSIEFVTKDDELPIMAGIVTQERVVELAMSRRAELIQAAAATDAFRLEVCAQEKVSRGSQVQTLASGTDLHAILVPQAIRNGEYRPGATPPEMPGALFGKKDDRVSRAIDISRRQDAQFEQVESLIKLEAINAYLTWKQTSEQMALAKKRFEAGKSLAELTRQNAGNVTQIELVQNFANAGLAQSQYLDAVFEHIKSMIALERVTAGAVKAGFPGR